jgi:hypothetical protein
MWPYGTSPFARVNLLAHALHSTKAAGDPIVLLHANPILGFF